MAKIKLAADFKDFLKLCLRNTYFNKAMADKLLIFDFEEEKEDSPLSQEGRKELRDKKLDFIDVD
jgi:hypothetical protein